jgi:hypothetical protein
MLLSSVSLHSLDFFPPRSYLIFFCPLHSCGIHHPRRISHTRPQSSWRRKHAISTPQRRRSPRYFEYPEGTRGYGQAEHCCPRCPRGPGYGKPSCCLEPCCCNPAPRIVRRPIQLRCEPIRSCRRHGKPFCCLRPEPDHSSAAKPEPDSQPTAIGPEPLGRHAPCRYRHAAHGRWQCSVPAASASSTSGRTGHSSGPVGYCPPDHQHDQQHAWWRADSWPDAWLPSHARTWCRCLGSWRCSGSQ